MKDILLLQEDVDKPINLHPKLQIHPIDKPDEEDYLDIDKIKYPEIKKPEDEEEHIYVKCDDASKYYGELGDDGSFLKENLFSELTTDYEREIARQNLGISSSYAMLWGNISGNLYRQEDLIKFVTENSTDTVNKFIEEIKEKLALKIHSITEEIKLKADINSPSFTGIPTTTNPLISDFSNRIPTTSWVLAVVYDALGGTNLKYLRITPDFVYADEPIPEITITWEYEEPVELLWIDNLELNTKIREFKVSGVDKTTYFRLKYIYGGVTYYKTIFFNVVLPLYVGTSDDYQLCKKSASYRINVDAKSLQYIYIFIPDGRKARLMVNGIQGGFSILGYIDLNKTKYYVFKSDNHSLGDTTVDIINQDFTVGQIKYLS